jgi:hypothetical protein
VYPLAHPEMYRAYGKKIGGGVLMYGPPGCGKTHLARATAGEVNAGFIAVGIHEVLDMWIGNSELPRQTSDAYYLYNRALELKGRHGAGHMTVCGHSLGGALSQHVGYWTKSNFVTFNAPGVYTGIQGTKVAFLHSPQKAVRTILATFSGSADGRNFRLSDDYVSRVGVHYGRLEDLLPGGGATGHGIAECIKALKVNGQGAQGMFI